MQGARRPGRSTYPVHASVAFVGSYFDDTPGRCTSASAFTSYDGRPFEEIPCSKIEPNYFPIEPGRGCLLWGRRFPGTPATDKGSPS